MNEKNTNELLKKYPVVFGQYKLPPTQTAMCWGFEHGDGWYSIIDCLAFIIQRENERVQEQDKGAEPMQAVQVKQKFAGLRFYMNYETDIVHGAIRMAESMSYRICEDCGSTQDVKFTSSFYVQSLCKKCRKILLKTRVQFWLKRSMHYMRTVLKIRR